MTFKKSYGLHTISGIFMLDGREVLLYTITPSHREVHNPVQIYRIPVNRSLFGNIHLIQHS